VQGDQHLFVLDTVHVVLEVIVSSLPTIGTIARDLVPHTGHEVRAISMSDRHADILVLVDPTYLVHSPQFKDAGTLTEVKEALGKFLQGDPDQEEFNVTLLIPDGYLDALVDISTLNSADGQLAFVGLHTHSYSVLQGDLVVGLSSIGVNHTVLIQGAPSLLVDMAEADQLQVGVELAQVVGEGLGAYEFHTPYIVQDLVGWCVCNDDIEVRGKLEAKLVDGRLPHLIAPVSADRRDATEAAYLEAGDINGPGGTKWNFRHVPTEQACEVGEIMVAPYADHRGIVITKTATHPSVVPQNPSILAHLLEVRLADIIIPDHVSSADIEVGRGEEAREFAVPV